MDKNYEAQEFAKLTEQLGDLSELGEKSQKASLAHLSDFCDVLSGLTCHVNRYITRSLSSDLESPPPLPDEIVLAFVASYEILCGLTEHMCILTCGEDDFDDEEDGDEPDASNN